MANTNSDFAHFRDQLYNVDSGGRRIGFFPKKPKGRFYAWRTRVAYLLLALMFGLPWIKVGGEPLFLFDVLHRKFIVFGITFWPQDFVMFALFAVSLVIFIFLFTSVLGRIWCGWTCPQTVFLEMVYRKIEFWIDGNSTAQRKLESAPWTWDKIKKRVLKHSIFIGIAFWVSNTVLAYVIGMDEVLEYMRTSPAQNLILFGAVIANTGIFYFVFAWFREQACIYMCPYGRLQSVLLDNDTLVISYDHVRGEPRGKLKKKSPDPNMGDCIDCKQCVAVCPTGIDIRNGTQLECVNCTACIDACDEIMDKVGRPRGLVRYASRRQIVEGKPFRLTRRAYVYVGVILALAVTFSVVWIGSSDLRVKILRAPGQTYTETPDGNITNLYNLEAINKTDKARSISFRLAGQEGSVRLIGTDSFRVSAAEQAEVALLVELPPSEVKGMTFDIEIELLEKNEVVRKVSTRFNGPMF